MLKRSLLILLIFITTITYADDTAPKTFPTLDDEITIYFDAFGVPNIYASTTHDLLFAQGYVHAADRWWQMEWLRHQGRGDLSSLAGSSMLESDILIRTIGLQRNAEIDLSLMSPEIRAGLEAYAEGVNAWIADKTPSELAIEYQYLPDTLTVEPWTVLDSLIFSQLLALQQNQGQLREELVRTGITDAAGPLAALLLMPPYPFDERPLIMEPGASAPTSFHENPSSKFVPPNLNLQKPVRLFPEGIGSNNWVISGSLTESGKPLLANDPHIAISMPGLWYQVGLHCTAISAACPYDVSGFSVPSAPLILIGHNQNIAWGVTNDAVDFMDSYALEINPENPNQYRYDGAWVDMDITTETLIPFDSDPVVITIRWTAFGPVVHELLDLESPIALHWSAMDGARSLDGIEQLNRAANWDEFQAAMSLMDTPGMSFVYADVENNIGYIATGHIPIRADGYTGAVTTPGTGSDTQWQGYVDPMENPRLFNPPAGFIVTANNAIMRPEDFPYPLTQDYFYGHRAMRITELLQAVDKHTVDTVAAIQFDSYNPAAAYVIPALMKIDFGDAALNAIVTWLGEWDYQNAVDSPQAAMFNVFWSRLIPLVFDELPFIPTGGSREIYVLSTMIESPHPLWQNAEMGTNDRVVILRLALQEALDFLTQVYGADRDAWRWGDLHVANFRAAPLGSYEQGDYPALDDQLTDLQALFNRQIPTSGGPSEVNATWWTVESGNFEVFALPSLRMIIDFNDFNNSRMVQTIGQSGDPTSPHYDDMLERWANGQYIPHDYTPDAVTETSQMVWRLIPE